MARKKVDSETQAGAGAAKPVDEDGYGPLSGWCMTGHCLPSEATSGCPGTFTLIKACPCPCHRGEVPEKALRQKAADEERLAAKDDEDDAVQS